MATKPVLFNTDMVRAILDGQKTVTRRVVKPQPFMVKQQENAPCWCGHFISESGKVLTDKPPYRPGDILYVRETWQPNPYGIGWPYFYKASPKQFDHAPNKWHPSTHMPKEAARIFLRVTNVRVERLQDITPEQIDTEGFKEYGYSVETGELMPSGPSFFMIGWDKTIKPEDQTIYGWAANPWVWVIEFERISKEEALQNE